EEIAAADHGEVHGHAPQGDLDDGAQDRPGAVVADDADQAVDPVVQGQDHEDDVVALPPGIVGAVGDGQAGGDGVAGEVLEAEVGEGQAEQEDGADALEQP